MPRSQTPEHARERKRLPSDPEPWEGARRPPAERPRHENAEPEDTADEAETSEAIAAESWGEVVEVRPEDAVDGDFNGNPELEGLEQTERWEGVDVLQGMEGREGEMPLESGAPEEVLAEAVAARRSVLADRVDEARELGLGSVFEAALAATDPAAGNTPPVVDDDVLRDQLAAIDAALEQLEARSASE